MYLERRKQIPSAVQESRLMCRKNQKSSVSAQPKEQTPTQEPPTSNPYAYYPAWKRQSDMVILAQINRAMATPGDRR